MSSVIRGPDQSQLFFLTSHHKPRSSFFLPTHVVKVSSIHSKVRGSLAKRMFQRFVSTSRICARREVVRYIVVDEVAFLTCFNIRGHCIRVSLKFGSDEESRQWWLERVWLDHYCPPFIARKGQPSTGWTFTPGAFDQLRFVRRCVEQPFCLVATSDVAIRAYH